MYCNLQRCEYYTFSLQTALVFIHSNVLWPMLRIMAYLCQEHLARSQRTSPANIAIQSCIACKSPGLRAGLMRCATWRPLKLATLSCNLRAYECEVLPGAVHYRLDKSPNPCGRNSSLVSNKHCNVSPIGWNSLRYVIHILE